MFSENVVIKDLFLVFFFFLFFYFIFNVAYIGRTGFHAGPSFTMKNNDSIRRVLSDNTIKYTILKIEYFIVLYNYI